MGLLHKACYALLGVHAVVVRCVGQIIINALVDCLDVVPFIHVICISDIF